MLVTCIKRKSVLKINFGLIFELPLKTGFTVPYLPGAFKQDGFFRRKHTFPTHIIEIYNPSDLER